MRRILLKKVDIFRFQQYSCYRKNNKPEPAQVGPYLKLKNSKRTSKCQSISEFETFYEKMKKKSQNAEKNKREDPLGFFNIHSVAKLQKIEGGPFGGNFFLKKNRRVPKRVG